jgi:lycopene beta-cyclase
LTISKQYDYIIAGAGCAGLSLAMHLLDSGKINDKKILIIDRDPKKSNDRTWCFWEKGEGLFEKIVHRQWERLLFFGENFSRELRIAPYRYKMIRGIDFYNFCFENIRKSSNVTIRLDPVDHVFSSELTTGIIVNGEAIHSEFVFNSILFKKPELHEKQYWLLQHFRGWIIETQEDRFDPELATLMDFRIGQNQGTEFCYVLPFTNRIALVEYTVFSPEVLSTEAYEERLRWYVSNILGISNYQVLEVESGVIPMTNYPFAKTQNHIINLGTAGGFTRGSTGYSFHFIQKHSAALTRRLTTIGDPFVKEEQRRALFYDSVLLHILHHQILPGKKIFSDLFRNNAPQQVLKFLDNETSLAEEMKILTSLPIFPFLKAALEQFI